MPSGADDFLPLMDEDPPPEIAVPGEDIWNKFDMLPTPPRSPQRDATDRLADLLQLFPPLHADDDPADVAAPREDLLRQALLRDCMWSTSLDAELDRSLAQSPVCGRPATPVWGGSQLSLSPVVVVAELAPVCLEDCVDPSSLWSPYSPFNDHCYIAAAHRNAAAQRGRPAASRRLSLDHVGSDTPSTSDSDEEIDVVTIDRQPPAQVRQHPQPVRQRVGRPPKNATVSSQRIPRKRTSAKPAVPTTVKLVRPAVKVLPAINVLQPTPKVFRPTLVPVVATTKPVPLAVRSPQPAIPEGRTGRDTSPVLGRCSESDSDDTEKRSMHNSMERKRRDDLRSAFYRLRDSVPELKDKPRAPKVLILTKAAVYVRQLTCTSSELERTIKAETRRMAQLQRKLQQLQRRSSRRKGTREM